MDSLNQILFDDKSFSDLLKEIHGNQKKKAKQLASSIAELKPLVQSLGDATVVVPLIKEYMEVAVKNDEHIVKVVAVIQRLISTGMRGTDDSDILTEAEKEQLLHELDEVAEEVQNRLDENEEKVASKTAIG